MSHTKHFDASANKGDCDRPFGVDCGAVWCARAKTAFKVISQIDFVIPLELATLNTSPESSAHAHARHPKSEERCAIKHIRKRFPLFCHFPSLPTLSNEDDFISCVIRCYKSWLISVCA